MPKSIRLTPRTRAPLVLAAFAAASAAAAPAATEPLPRVASINVCTDQHLLALARTTAFFAGRDYVLPADVKRIAPDALRHRLIRTVRAEAENISPDEIIDEMLGKVPIP